MFAYLLITCSPVYLFFSYWLWRVWNFIYTVFSNTAWFFSIRTDLVYRYYFPVSFDMLSLDVLTYTMLSHRLSDITLMSCCHLTSGITYLTLIIITITGMMTWHLDYILIYPEIIQYKPYSWYTCLLILLTCSYSFLKSDNYLINYKKRQLTLGQRKLTDINIYIFVFTVVFVCCAIKTFGST